MTIHILIEFEDREKDQELAVDGLGRGRGYKV